MPTIPILKPMLAPEKCSTLTELQPLLNRWPYMVSEKLNGIRMLIYPDGLILSRSGRKFSNTRINDYLKGARDLAKETGCILDGEFYSPVDSWGTHLAAHSSHNFPIPEDFNYNLFDAMFASEWEGPYILQYQHRYVRLFDFECHPKVKVLEHKRVYNWTILQTLYEAVIERGGEGLIVRNTEGGYKHGRATIKEHTLFKLKKRQTYTGVIIDVKAAKRLRADADISANAYGDTKRSRRADQIETTEELGGITVKLNDGRLVECGSGFDNCGAERDRSKLWLRRDSLRGLHVEIEATDLGSKERPLTPTFKGFRPDLDTK